MKSFAVSMVLTGESKVRDREVPDGVSQSLS